MKQITLQGIAYDAKSSFLKGPAKAPKFIRDMYHSPSANYFAENGIEITPEYFEDKGDLHPSEYFDIEAFTKKNMVGHQPLITLGGDHSISYPLIRAMHGKWGLLEVLHIDAHADLYDRFDGDPYSHACPFARILEEKLVSRLVQVGVRTLSAAQRKQADRFGVEIIEMKDYSPLSIPAFSGNLYLSLDIDALDPAFAPGISHYEPGGFSTREVLEIIQNIDGRLIGADIVEYNPDRDLNGQTAMVCAKFLKEIACQMLRP